MTNFRMSGGHARKVMSALCAAGVVVALSACGVEGGKAPADPAASAIPSVTATQTGVKAGDVINGLPTKKELANDGKGDYIQTTIAPDDPALTYNPAIVNQEDPSLFSEEEIKEAQKFVMTFIAEEGLDSTLNDNSADPKIQDAWWAKHKDQIDPAYRDALYADVKSNDPNRPIVFRGQFRQDGTTKYSLINGKDVTHVHSRKITPTKIAIGVSNGQKLIGIDSKVDFSMNAVLNGKNVVEATSATVGYTVTKSLEGKWLIAGYSTYATTTPIVG